MAQRKNKKSRFCEVCPRKLNNLPDSPCPLALVRMELIKAGKRESPDLPGCPYAITERRHNYCFWSLADSDSFGAMSSKEISKSLSLTSAQIEKAEKSAVQSLKDMGHLMILKKWAEAVKDAHEGLHEQENIYTAETLSDLVVIDKEDDHLDVEVLDDKN